MMRPEQHPAGFYRMFHDGGLTLGVFFPIESYRGDVPRMEGQPSLARMAESLGFAAVWVRDVPLRDPTFGDVGQIYDPWVWLGYVLAQTRTIALATGSVILPLRHPLHVAKAAASVANLSGGRLFLGVASGDRPVEFPAFGVDPVTRDKRFREALRFIREAMDQEFPTIESSLGRLHGADPIPKPVHGRLPVGVTGNSRQGLDWIARNADAWIMYPRSPSRQAQVVGEWRDAVNRFGGGPFKPFAQSLYIDLAEDPSEPARPIHLGFRAGRVALVHHLEQLQEAGVNHVALNLKYGSRPAEEVMEELGAEVIPSFPVIARAGQPG